LWVNEEDFFKAKEGLRVELLSEIEVRELCPGLGVGGVCSEKASEVGDGAGDVREMG